MAKQLGDFLTGNGRMVDQQAFRREVTKLSSMANKRIARLEQAGLTSSPAYKKWFEDGGQKFGVKGKTINEVQAEMSRLNSFINSNTSTIRGLNSTLKEMAANTGIKYSNIQELHKKSEKFFELSSKVEQYLRTVEDMASAIGYQKIWEAVNQYVKETGVDLGSTNLDVDQMAGLLGDALANLGPTDNSGTDYINFRDQYWMKLK